MLVKFIKLVSEKNTYMSNFTAFANADNKNFYHQQLTNPAVTEVLRLRKVALEKSIDGNFGIEAIYWFEQSTKRIGLFKKIE